MSISAQISNDPILGVKRVVFYQGATDNNVITPGAQSITRDFRVRFYGLDDVELPENYIKSYVKSIEATNTLFVNSQGAYVDEGTPGAKGEYDFIMGLYETNISLKTIITAGIARMDTAGLFNRI